MAYLLALLLCIVLSGVIGFLIGAYQEFTRQKSKGSISNYKPLPIRLKQYQIGNEEINITLFKPKDRFSRVNTNFGELEVLEQIKICCNLTEGIVGNIIAYDLKWFETDNTVSGIQYEVDAFFINVEKYNRFLEQPRVAVISGIDEATNELLEANRPIIDRLTAIRESVDDYIKEGGYHIIEFRPFC